MRIAFYAPMKPPGHAAPSGDRTIARLFLRALEGAGHEVTLASEHQSWEGEGDAGSQRRIRARGEAEAARLIGAYWERQAAERPDLWFTYHLYHKAPDWLGPAVCRALGIPYVIAEAATAPRQADGPWAEGHAAARDAIHQADRVLAMTRDDMVCLRDAVAEPERLLHIPPFIDSAPFTAAASSRAPHRARLARDLGLDPDGCWLLAVAMMRAGDKVASYQALGAALAGLGTPEWRLLVVGDGAGRQMVEAALAPLGNARLAWLGALAPADLPPVYAAADVYVWPAVREAYGMAFLEAQAAGLPVVAGRVGGVPDVVSDDESGILVAPGLTGAFADAVGTLIRAPDRRRAMGAAAAAYVRRRHDLAVAAENLQAVLAPLEAARRESAA